MFEYTLVVGAAGGLLYLGKVIIDASRDIRSWHERRQERDYGYTRLPGFTKRRWGVRP